MTRVDFYLLSQSAADRLTLASRLCEKAYLLGRRIYVLVPDMLQARELDERLWTFRDGSFVPHGLVNESNPKVTPVLIASKADSPPNENDVLLNLSPDVPPFFLQFERIAEVVDASADARQSAREHYRFYREHGCSLDTHEIER